MIFNGIWPLLYLEIPRIRRLSPILLVTALRNYFLPDFYRCYSEYLHRLSNPRQQIRQLAPSPLPVNRS